MVRPEESIFCWVWPFWRNDGGEDGRLQAVVSSKRPSGKEAECDIARWVGLDLQGHLRKAEVKGEVGSEG